MSALRRRVLALDRHVHWLETEGMFRNIKAMIRIVEMKQAIADRIAIDPEAAARWAEADYGLVLPPPRVTTRRPPAPPPPPPVAAEPPRPAPEPAREQPPAAAPPVVAPRPPPEPPVPAWQPYDPPEQMQIRPVHWRPRGAADYLDDDVDDADAPEDDDYDPFADV